MSERSRRQVAEWSAMPMYCLSLAFLIVIAILLVLWVDVPLFLTPEEGAIVGESGATISPRVTSWITHHGALRAGYACLTVLAIIWPIFPLELLFQFLIRDRGQPFWRQRLYSLLVCFCPPLRMCARNFDMDGNIWFPTLGWQQLDDGLRERLEKMFSIPMIVIALIILPVLLVEFGMKHLVDTHPWLQLLLHVSMGLIWFAFAAEFIVMISVAEKKLKYCRTHWIDLAIILLPFISFLRTLRVVRATRVARLAKIQQLSRMGRLYRLRGLVMRALRALMILKLLNRLFRIGPERQLKQLHTVLDEKEREIETLRRDIEELEREIARRDAETARESEQQKSTA